MKRKSTLKWSMIRMLTLCWFAPLLVIIIFMMITVGQKVNRQVENTITTSTNKAVEICGMRLQDAITASKNASYMQSIRTYYNQYRSTGNERMLYENVTLYLEQQYKYNSSFKCTMLYFTDRPERIYYTYRDRRDATYTSIQQYRSQAEETVQEKAKQIGTATAFVRVGHAVYMVRNIVNPKYEPIAVIIMELDTDEIFESLESVWSYEKSEVYIDGVQAWGDSAEQKFYEKTAVAQMKQCSYSRDSEGACVYQQTRCGRSTVTYGIQLDSVAIIEEVEKVRFIFLAEVLFLIPMVFMIIGFFQRRVNKPIGELTRCAREIEGGNYGCQIDQKSRDEEFYYLDDAFNQMSSQLKLQFEKIYLEEIALRDANIMALQSQINPHFLNNTLEIINWEARLQENYKVSGMIEALSTMLEATMNRKGEQLITIEEELNYVEAYIFIIAQRFGEKFEYRKDVDEGLLYEKIPRLIIQPIIENAVEHGMNMTQKGWISLRIYEENGAIYIEVKDNGKLTEEDKKRIDELLSADCDGKKSGSTSLGIRNVNRRIKIIYGEKYGLFFTSSEHNHTISTIVVHKNSHTAQKQARNGKSGNSDFF